jgi:NAD(P)-dependent dehydrogenase (short-subunit alcohol dehydrogenase family)
MSVSGKTILITGATGGIGLEAARALASIGAHIVIGARDAARGKAVVEELTRAGGRAQLLTIDMASFASVRRAVERFGAAHPALDVLINNAGVAVRDRQVNADGHEITWATNFLGPFLLTRLLLPFLVKAPRPRVVNVSSTAHRFGRIDWEDLELSRGFRSFKAYANTKLALVLFTRELARRQPGIAANALHPGAIATGIWRSAPPLARWILARVLPSAKKGAGPVVRLAAAPELDGVTGRYFNKFREAIPAPAAANDADAARLWEIADEATSRPGSPSGCPTP